MALSKKAYKGCRDLFPQNKRKLDYLFSKIRSHCERYAYEPYDGPLLESLDVYLAKSGEEIVNEQLYSFTDRGGRHVAIRPEMTPTLARMVAQTHRELPKPIRWYSTPNLMRYEKPQKGRLREHWQFNCDIFGAPESHGEFEVLQLLITLLTSFGANEKQFTVFINDRQITDYLFNKLLKLDQDKSYKLYKIIDKAKKVSQVDLDKMLHADFSLSETKVIKEYLQCQSLKEITAFGEKYQMENITQNLFQLYQSLESVGLSQFLQYDPAIVRGLDYYTGVVFEVFDLHPDNKRAICGGGAYKNLLQIFNEQPLAGVGFGLGDVTFLDFLETHKLIPDFKNAPTDILVTFQEQEHYHKALAICHQLRTHWKKNIELHPIPIKPKKGFQIAEKKSIKHLIMIGSREVEGDYFFIKNLNTQESQEIKINNIQNHKGI